MNTHTPHAVILHGAPGADLARFSGALADAYACDHVISDYVPLRSPLVPRGLHLATVEPDPAQFGHDILILPIDQAITETVARGLHS